MSCSGELARPVKVFFFFISASRPKKKKQKQKFDYFRDQNFGLNDLASVQDVRNDFTQQDIDDSTVIKDKGENVLDLHPAFSPRVSRLLHDSFLFHFN